MGRAGNPDPAPTPHHSTAKNSNEGFRYHFSRTGWRSRCLGAPVGPGTRPPCQPHNIKSLLYGNGTRLALTLVIQKMRGKSSFLRRVSRRCLSTDSNGVEIPTNAFLGLGAMGYPMAGNLTSRNRMLVWNRNKDVAVRHQASHGTILLDDDFEGLKDVQSVFLCVPTSVEVEDLMKRAVAHMSLGQWW